VALLRRTAHDDATVGIEFNGFADDCRIHGRVASLGERLTDVLNAGERITVREVRLEALTDGAVHALPVLTLELHEICAVVGLGPRGFRDQRIRTEEHRLRLGVGPYVILGDLHAPPNRDPMGEVLKRPAMVPLTNATLAYTFKGQPEVADVGTIIVNRHVTEWIEPAVEEQTESFPGVRVRTFRLKDMSGLRTD
jgi:hypothetical protein